MKWDPVRTCEEGGGRGWDSRDITRKRTVRREMEGEGKKVGLSICCSFSQVNLQLEKKSKVRVPFPPLN